MQYLDVIPSRTLWTPPKSEAQIESVFSDDLRGKLAELSAAAKLWNQDSELSRYFARKSDNTFRERISNVAKITAFVEASGINVSELRFDGPLFNRRGEPIMDRSGDQKIGARYVMAENLAAWDWVTHDIVQAMVAWMLAEGYTPTTVNNTLSGIRMYAKLAGRAGYLDAGSVYLICSIEGYDEADIANMRDLKLITEANRKSSKKSEMRVISDSLARALIEDQPDGPQGIRDALMMSLLLDHGLRVSELEILLAENVVGNELHFSRPKIKSGQYKTGRHTLHHRTQYALRSWERLRKIGGIPGDSPRLLRGSRKGGKLTTAGMSDSAIRARVKLLGEAVGLENYSPHEARHYCATRRSKRANARLEDIMAFFGWTSAQTALNYMHADEVQEA